MGNTIKIDNCNWQKKCPRCNEWFDIVFRFPGTKFKSSLPPYCKDCIKKMNAENRKKNPRKKRKYQTPIPKKPKKEKAKNIKTKEEPKAQSGDIINGGFESCYHETADALNGFCTLEEFMKLPTRPNPYYD